VLNPWLQGATAAIETLEIYFRLTFVAGIDFDKTRKLS
jgi:hypothetical protein